MSKTLGQELRENLEGEVRDDIISRAVYSVDASIYEIAPIAIALPKSLQEVAIAMEIARHHNVPIIPRGAATGITGGCLGQGWVIDTSKYLRKIHEGNFEEEYAICDPGVVQNQLNAALAPRDYRLGPDTSTGNRATLGGMLANNSAGARSLRYGKWGITSKRLNCCYTAVKFLDFTPWTPANCKKNYSYQDVKETFIARYCESGRNMPLILLTIILTFHVGLRVITLTSCSLKSL
jgi:hypothetical protein